MEHTFMTIHSKWFFWCTCRTNSKVRSLHFTIDMLRISYLRLLDGRNWPVWLALTGAAHRPHT